jgi:hypothetical protein
MSVAILAQVVFGSITMDRAAKLRKLDAFRRRVPHVSASALSVIVSELQRESLDLFDRNSIRDARNLRVDEETPYGPVITTVKVEHIDGSFSDVFITNPFAQLYSAAKTCRGFAYLLKSTLAVSPSTFDTPWSFLIYSDEVVPGNQLSFNKLRKVWVLYFSVK